jgi:hypothetical protein
MKTRFTLAASLLARIGGLAAMVAGVGGSYYPDRATEPRSRKGKSAGQYGRNLRAHFARERMKMPLNLRGKSLT